MLYMEKIVEILAQIGWRKILAIGLVVVAIILAMNLTSCSVFQRAGLSGTRVTRSTSSKTRDVVDTMNYGVVLETTQTTTTTRYR